MFSKPVSELIRTRKSTRSYLNKPVEPQTITLLDNFCKSLTAAPFGSKARFSIIAADPDDSRALKGLGTYGFIKSPQGFIIGAAGDSEFALIDFGYLMEKIILYATDLGIATCWLGGFFKRSRFSKKAGLKANESIPAVTSMGYELENSTRDASIRKSIGAATRKSYDKLFFKNNLDTPLPEAEMGLYKPMLDGVRLAPSASNQQPWRILKRDNHYHFFLKRTPGYGKSFIFKLIKMSDIQKVDMGIALCHFDLLIKESNLKGRWINDPQPSTEELTEYCFSWKQD